MKILTLLLCAVMVVSCTVAGVLAWVIDESQPVKNTFSASRIQINLDESKYEPSNNSLTTATRVKTNDNYKMLPGWTLLKDPKVTVEGGSEACWLFIKLQKAKEVDEYLEYDIASGWTSLSGADGVYYREVDKSDSAQGFDILQGNQVKVKETVDLAQMNGLIESRKSPQMTFTAYAVQLEKGEGQFSVDEAWAEAQKLG